MLKKNRADGKKSLSKVSLLIWGIFILLGVIVLTLFISPPGEHTAAMSENHIPDADETENVAGDSEAAGESAAEEKSNNDKAIIISDIEQTNYPGFKPGPHTYEVKARVHESMPEYRFVAKGLLQRPEDWAFGYVIGLDVFDENGKSILSADFSETSESGQVVGYPVFNEMMDTMGLHVTDVNFDGYKDVIILNTFAGAHANTWYDCWLWDSKTSSFVKSESFSEICNPALDRDNECIYSAGGSGAAYWGGRIYKFIDDEFVLTNELDTDFDGLVERALVNGKMEVVREVSFDGDEQIIEREMEYYRNNELWQLSHPRWYWYGGHHADKWLE